MPILFKYILSLNRYTLKVTNIYNTSKERLRLS
nr:MAG TPA: hypothetical protein [Crassvirales sp.]